MPGLAVPFKRGGITVVVRERVNILNNDWDY